jgi:tRNA pseudouridine55 synthase
MTDGVLLVDKPPGMTSHDAVDRVRKTLGIKKVGHSGTLDPMASGLLVMGIGRATRLLRFLSDLDKEYEGTGKLGVETDTLDAEGQVTRTSDVDVGESDLTVAMKGLTGEFEQVPPAFSAVQVGGERLYKAARRGEPVEAPPRPVRVDRFELERFRPPDFDFRVVCSSGTYVRSLVADVGTSTGPGAHLTRLTRTRIGHFKLSNATKPDEVTDPLPLEMAVVHMPRMDLSDDEVIAARHGRPLGPPDRPGFHAAVDPSGRLVGIYRDCGTKSCPEVVIPE